MKKSIIGKSFNFRLIYRRTKDVCFTKTGNLKSSRFVSALYCHGEVENWEIVKFPFNLRKYKGCFINGSELKVGLFYKN